MIRILFIALCCLVGGVSFADWEHAVEQTEVGGSVVWFSDCSVPTGVVDGDEHAAVANRKNVDFVFGDFVNDAIGFDDQLVEAIGVRRYGVIALDGNGRARQGKIAKSDGSFAKLCLPANSVVGIEFGAMPYLTKEAA